MVHYRKRRVDCRFKVRERLEPLHGTSDAEIQNQVAAGMRLKRVAELEREWINSRVSVCRDNNKVD